MYINIKKQILSKSILLVALVKIVAALVEGLTRLLLKKANLAAPDMLDKMAWNIQLTSSCLQMIVITFIFYSAWKKLTYYMNLIPPEERSEMGALQHEFLGDKIASLSASSVSRLLQLWAVIFIGAELIYDFTSIMYRKFIALLIDALENAGGLSDGTFILLYNMTHGFKYLEILAALLLGVVMTGIFLNDRYLKLASLSVIALFLLAFGLFQMQTVSLMGREIGIVWTSIIYHITETAGLLILSLYLTKQYKGL